MLTLSSGAYGTSIRYLLAMVLIGSLSACASPRFENHDPSLGEAMHEDLARLNRPGTAQPEKVNVPKDVAHSEAPAPDNSFYKPGTDSFVHTPHTVAQKRVHKSGDIELNFQDANLLEVIKIILGDILDESFMVHAQVHGSVSMRTSSALSKEDMIPTLEMLLRMNNAALVRNRGVYTVIPQERAFASIQAPQLGDSSQALPSGYSVQIIPLRHVGVLEMVQILEPLLTGSQQLLRADTQRNLLILAGSGGDLGRLLDTIEMFDVNQMSGMSMAMFTPNYVDAQTLATELEQLLADPSHGLMQGLVRIVVVERLNGLIVVTPRAHHLAQVRTWVQRLDRESGGTGSRLFIYRVQNGKALDLADTLNQLFEHDRRRPAVPSVKLAPGMRPASIGADEQKNSQRTLARAQASKQIKARPTDTVSGSNGLAMNRSGEVRVIADEPNNALLILANATEYRQILSALQQLDVSPMQVLVEVTIAEVTLTDNLQYGVEWYLKSKFDKGLNAISTLDLGSASGLTPLAPGFSYAVQSAPGDVRGVLNVLATESNLSVISSPSLLVLNNQSASIQVGEEVPVSIRQQQAADVTANILNSIEYRDTGVLLNVTPRINAGGLVIMDVEQEISQVPSTGNTDPLTPRIQKRSIQTSVAVNSGDTIILGGLIQNNRDRSEAGLPFLHKLPLIGALFGNKADNRDRTELLVLITPQAVSNRSDAMQVTEQFRHKLNSLIPASNALQN